MVTPYAVLEIRGLPSEDDARRLLARVFSDALPWTIVNTGCGLTPEQTEVDRVSPNPDPEAARQSLRKAFGLALEHPVHGIADGNAPVIYRMDQNLRFVTAGRLGVSLGQPGSNLLASLDEALRFTRRRIDPDADLATAIFASSRYESSPGVRFLQLMTALEVLLPDVPRPPVAQELIGKFAAAIEDTECGVDANSRESLDRLRQALLGMKNESIGHRLRTMVRSLLGLDRDVADVSRRVGALYAKRSRLTHGGRGGPSVNETLELEGIVRRLLRARLLDGSREVRSSPEVVG